MTNFPKATYLSQSCEEVTVMSLTIATLNLCNYCAPPYCFYDFESSYTKSQWQQKQSWLFELLNATSPDVVCFQEVFSLNELSDLISPLGLCHFATCDEAVLDANNPYLFKRPIVVIAAKYPLTNVRRINHPSFLQMAPLSREVINCEMEHPKYGHIRLYGTHLKSKRATDFVEEHPKYQTMPADCIQHIGRLLSDKQRSDEAMALYFDFITQQVSNPLATFVMGDFNQQAIQSNLAFFTEHTEFKDNLDVDLKLLDSFYLSSLLTRKPTHYYYGNGSVLDYIVCPESILSQLNLKELNFNVLDSHISQDEINVATDHAMVTITLC
ncbi:endonuclease/exonuclease/phosphatase family protein [Pseudoalteromonas sp. SSM20]|uniref:endonuclease/exonuclease/phosphatase family protein n=1 Tax=Pseudoalteromonas sp. SSM20 TaxID=3139394 RepID=UPI003BABF543